MGEIISVQSLEIIFSQGGILSFFEVRSAV